MWNHCSIGSPSSFQIQWFFIQSVHQSPYSCNLFGQVTSIALFRGRGVLPLHRILRVCYLTGWVKGTSMVKNLIPIMTEIFNILVLFLVVAYQNHIECASQGAFKMIVVSTGCAIAVDHAFIYLRGRYNWNSSQKKYTPPVAEKLKKYSPHER